MEAGVKILASMEADVEASGRILQSLLKFPFDLKNSTLDRSNAVDREEDNLQESAIPCSVILWYDEISGCDGSRIL